ncbi:hypothetical protein, partial [Paenilisteria newyorkensis]|uniref:hypothetical protein n=1 Tax=Listeria newyorkensis TaxID=1497681 RepID=UPI00163F322A
SARCPPLNDSDKLNDVGKICDATIVVVNKPTAIFLPVFFIFYLFSVFKISFLQSWFLHDENFTTETRNMYKKATNSYGGYGSFMIEEN